MFSLFKQIYDTSLQSIFKLDSNLSEVDLFRTTVCSFIAGICSKVALYPCDLVKKRMQVQGFADGRAALGKTYAYNGAVDCVRSILQYEGFLGLYKGLFPGLVKAAVVSSSSLVAYEFVKNAIVNINASKN